MMAYSNTSISHPDVGVHLVGDMVAYGPCAGRAQIARWTEMTSACKAMALASALVIGGSVPALAVDPPDPAANKVWGGCVLTPTTVTGLIGNIGVGQGIQGNQVKVSFVVVYTLAYDNNGQPLTGSGSSFTGPVICRNPSEVGITAFDKGGEGGQVLLKETTDIPTQTDPGVPQATSVDILDAEEAFFLRYVLNNGANAGKNEKRVCHTTDGNVDCFRIFGAP